MKLIVMCGIPGRGKSTLIKNSRYKIISRDKIRLELLKEEDEFFSKEQEVLDKFYQQIQENIDNNTDIIVDSTLISKKARINFFNHLRLNDNVEIYIVVVDPPVSICLERNEQHIGRAYVPRSTIRRMSIQFEFPTQEEGIKYKKIIEVKK